MSAGNNAASHLRSTRFTSNSAVCHQSVSIVCHVTDVKWVVSYRFCDHNSFPVAASCRWPAIGVIVSVYTLAASNFLRKSFVRHLSFVWNSVCLAALTIANWTDIEARVQRSPSGHRMRPHCRASIDPCARQSAIGSATNDATPMIMSLILLYKSMRQTDMK